MSKEKSDWDWSPSPDGKKPVLRDHSKAKLRILVAYVRQYIDIVLKNHQVRSFNLSIVDGFAGGGIYKGGEVGSPLALYQTVEEAKEAFNRPIDFSSRFFFVEKKDNNRAHLCGVLRERDIPPSAYSVHGGEFDDVYQKNIVKQLRARHPRDGGGVLFFLDQCGHTDVSIATLRHIHDNFSNAEVVMNFSISTLVNLLSDSGESRKVLSGLEFSNDVISQIIQLKSEGIASTRAIIENIISAEMKRLTGFEYFSPFFIEPVGNSRGYWLLHFAHNFRAHNAMMEVLWQHGNDIMRHYGGSGLKAFPLRYKGENAKAPDLLGQQFNALAHQMHAERLVDEIAKYMRDNHRNGLALRDLVKNTCNDTVADVDMYKKAVLDSHSGVIVRGRGGGKKRSDSVTFDDIIYPEITLWSDLGRRKK